MNILFLSWEYPPETGGGGIGSYVACAAPALVDRGHEVHVLSCAPGQETRDYVDRGVHIHRRPQLTVRGFGRLTRSMHAHARLNLAWSHWYHARKLGVAVDVVETPECGAEGLIFALSRAAPLVTHLHTPLHRLVEADQRTFGWSERLGDLLERATARRADVISSPSRLLLDDCLRSGWLRPGRTHHRVVRYPIDLDRWAGSRELEPSSTVVLSVGRLEPRKGGDVLLRAARLLTDEGTGCEVVFVGRSTRLADGSEYRTTLERLASQLDVACRFVDQVERRRLLEWYGRARVVAVPSRYDNFPMAGLEAMAARRPVVCTDNVGTAELLAGTDAGTVVPPEDPAALAGALRPYLSAPETARQAGEAARRVVETGCAPATIAAQREKLYAEAREAWERSATSRLWRGRTFPRVEPVDPAEV